MVWRKQNGRPMILTLCIGMLILSIPTVCDNPLRMGSHFRSIAVLHDLQGDPQMDADRRRRVEQDDSQLGSFKSFRVAYNQ